MIAAEDGRKAMSKIFSPRGLFCFAEIADNR
jgi:hypothetical protein